MRADAIEREHALVVATNGMLLVTDSIVAVEATIYDVAKIFGSAPDVHDGESWVYNGTWKKGANTDVIRKWIAMLDLPRRPLARTSFLLDIGGRLTVLADREGGNLVVANRAKYQKTFSQHDKLFVVDLPWSGPCTAITADAPRRFLATVRIYDDPMVELEGMRFVCGRAVAP